jgi:hypothetical protein
MFASRWPKGILFHPGWITSSEVVRAVSDTPEGPYEFQEVVLPARGAEYWDGRSTHNPHITKHQDTYILYYMGSTHPLGEVLPGQPFSLTDPRSIVGRANKRIGIATAKSVFGPWERRDDPVVPTRPATCYSFLTSNPAPCVHADGSVLLAFKSRHYVGNTHNGMMINLAQADHYTGPYRMLENNPAFGPEHLGEIEDPFIWQTGHGYEMIAKDMLGTLCGEEGAGVHACSADGAHWQLCADAKAYSRAVLWEDGVTRMMGSLERPFLLIQDGRPTHLFAATADGPGGFERASHTWNMVIPLGE